MTSIINCITTETVFDGADEAWRAAIRSVIYNGDTVEPVRDPFSIGSGFGKSFRNTKEVRAAQFTIGEPRRRLIRSSARQFKLEHAVAQLFWVICGTNDLDAIAFYHSFGAKLSEDGKTVFAAPGSRIFSTPFGDQFESAVACLQSDSASRRAIIQIFTPEDAAGKRRDVPCFLSVQLMVRGGSLHALTTMRSQSTVMVLPHDLFLLFMLHEAAARRLSVPVGKYTHWAGSLHVYGDEIDLGETILRERPVPPLEMSPMPRLDHSWRKDLITAELAIRTRLSEDIRQPIDLSTLGVNTYWAGLLAVLIVAARRQRGQAPIDSDYEQMLPELRAFLRGKDRDECEGSPKAR